MLEQFRLNERVDLHPSDPGSALTDTELAAAADLVTRLSNAMAPFENLSGSALPLSDLAARHRTVVAALSQQDSEVVAFSDRDGARLAGLLDELATSRAAAGLLVKPSDYVELFSAASRQMQVVAAPRKPGMRVQILGPIEARLTKSDRVVLGGLVEGTWPPESQTDAWLSRPMRLKLGLDLPERRIGLSAHDFAQLLGAREVILTHATKIAGTPTVAVALHPAPRRRLRRRAGKDALKRGENYLAWARELDRPETIAPEPQPAPKPPRAARPTGLSVTEIEHWLRDPYTIYAKHILRLTPLDPIGAEPGAAERGTFIHNAIGEFTQRFAKELPDNPARALIELGRPHFAALNDYPEARAFWWPRFERIARWFARWEMARRAGISAITAEIRGEIDISAWRRHVQAARHCRSHRARRRRPLHDPRLQDRRGANRKAGAHRTGAAAHP